MDALYSKYRFGIFLMFLFLGPIIVLGAKAAMESNSNKVADWLPEGFEETKQLKWFAEKFGSDELLMVSWEGCTLSDPRVARVAVPRGGALREGPEIKAGTMRGQVLGRTGRTRRCPSRRSLQSGRSAKTPGAL